MKKLSKDIYWSEDNNVISLIEGLIESRENGDWNEYNEGDIVRYFFDFDDECYSELLDEENIKLDEVKEFIKEGICYVVDYDIWYNIRFENNMMITEYEYVKVD
jgi:hypothetical protein